MDVNTWYLAAAALIGSHLAAAWVGQRIGRSGGLWPRRHRVWGKGRP